MRAQETIFITGGGSGIGMGLAAAFHARGATVIIAGRTRSSLEAVVAKHPGMEIEEIDVADAALVSACATRIAERHPSLSMVVNSAGIQNLIDFASDTPISSENIAQEIDINLKGLIMVSNAFLPLLKRQPRARLILVGSGLGFIPLTAAPIYSATKAAVHSFAISLRRQLRGTNVQLIEIIPPVVETALHRGQSRKPPNAMPLNQFVAEAMSGLTQGRDEIAVSLAKVLRIAHRIVPKLFLNIVNKPHS